MIRKMCLVVALVVAFGPFAFAQRGGGGRGGGGGMGGGGGFPGGFGAQQPVDKLESMTKELKLTDAQKADVIAIMDAGQKQSSDLLKKLGDLRQQIMNQNLKGEDPAASIKLLADISTQIGTMEVDAFTKIVAKLDDKQKSKAPKLFEMINNGFTSGNWVTAR